MERASRVDTRGLAFAGSQMQVQLYSARHRKRLEAAILTALGRGTEQLQWLAPLEDQRFEEPMDGAFLETLELPQLIPDLAAFWPRSGPRWDGLARLDPSCTVLLVEGKSYPAEMRGSGCQAYSEESRRKIEAALHATKVWLQASAEANWTGPLYQYANRLAHVRFLRERGVDAWLVNLCFTDDDTTTPTSAEEWQFGLNAAKRELGVEHLDGVALDVLLPALSRDAWEAQ
ncbi:MAG: hypothetical protein ACK5Z1_15300 [Gemmatimonadota bacterium]